MPGFLQLPVIPWAAMGPVIQSLLESYKPAGRGSQMYAARNGGNNIIELEQLVVIKMCCSFWNLWFVAFVIFLSL